MFRRLPSHLRAGLLLLGLSGLGAGLSVWSSACADAGARAEAPGAAADALAVRRGALRPRVLLTGELVAERAVQLKVPRVKGNSQLQIRWMAEDGAEVARDQPVVEFDNSSFTSEIVEKRLQASEAHDELDRKRAEADSATAEKVFAVEQRRAELQKARIEAAVPKELLALTAYQEKQLALLRAEVALAKAEKDLEAHRASSAADLGIQRITLERARREIRDAEEAISVLTLRAPQNGIFLAGEIPWEGRKLQAGDSVFLGHTVGSIPDLQSFVVHARLSDVDDGKIAPGLPAVCALDSHPAATFRGRVATISPVARDVSRNSLMRYFPVRVVLDRMDPRMQPGMSVRVEVQGREIRGAVIAPRAGLDLGSTPPRARLAGGQAIEVKLGPCTASECVILSGLKEGDRLRGAA